MLGFCTCLGFCSPKKAMLISVIRPAGYFLMDTHGFVLHEMVYHADCIHKPSRLLFLYMYHTMLGYCTCLSFCSSKKAMPISVIIPAGYF